MKLIIALLALSAMYAAEVTPQPKPELPADVKAKIEEIHQLREAQRQATEIKVGELKVILENYPKLREHILKRLEDRREDRKDGGRGLGERRRNEVRERDGDKK